MGFQYTTQEFCQSEKENKRIDELGEEEGRHEISVLFK